MFEKVNPSHPDKIADRIAGAIVDLAYGLESNPKIAVEVLIGHGICHVIAETSTHIPVTDIESAVKRIAGENVVLDYHEVAQDSHLAKNQESGIRCGDNGIFKGTPVTAEQRTLSHLARAMYLAYPYDGKFVLDEKLTICQSNADTQHIKAQFSEAIVNPLGDWTGGTDVDTGATNRKLGSDMGDGVTGGGLHGKDLSKADVSVNIYAWLKAQEYGCPVSFSCSIGDESINGIPYQDIVETARQFITKIGGFEKFAEWGLV